MKWVALEMTSRDLDRNYWPLSSSLGKPLPLPEVEDKLANLNKKYIKLTDLEPLPVDELEELNDQIDRLEKLKSQLWDAWQNGLLIAEEERI